MTTTDTDVPERAALGAALASPDDPILLPPDGWQLLRTLARLAGPMPGDDPVTRAVIAERERIAQVAEDLGAHYHDADRGQPTTNRTGRNTMTATETTGDELAVFLEEARNRFRRAGTSPNLARNLESWIDSANDVPGLLAEVARLRSELDRTGNACQLLGQVVTGQARTLEAARIELVQGHTPAALEWILNGTPDVDDNDPADQWDGTETAQEWFYRTDDRKVTA